MLLPFPTLGFLGLLEPSAPADRVGARGDPESAAQHTEARSTLLHATSDGSTPNVVRMPIFCARKDFHVRWFSNRNELLYKVVQEIGPGLFVVQWIGCPQTVSYVEPVQEERRGQT